VTSSGLLRGVTLSGAVSGAVDSPRGGRSGSARVELWVVTWKKQTRSAINALREKARQIVLEFRLRGIVVGKGSRCSREGKFTQKLIEVLFAIKQKVRISHWSKIAGNPEFPPNLSGSVLARKRAFNSAYLGPYVGHDACCFGGLPGEGASTIVDRCLGEVTEHKAEPKEIRPSRLMMMGNRGRSTVCGCRVQSD
jgi:hypothetical protein